MRRFGLVVVAACAGAFGGLLASPVESPARPKDLYARVTHLGWIVRDVDETAAAWQRLGVRRTEAPVAEAFDVTAPDGTRHVRVKKVNARIGAVRIDWMQPLDAGGPFRAFLERHGEGVHHVGYTVRDEGRFEGEAKAFTALAGGSVEVGTRRCAQTHIRFARLRTTAGGGMTIELAFDPSAPEVPPPSANDDPFNRVTQFAFVVRDAAAVSRSLEGLGFAPLAIEPNISLDRVYRGAPGMFEMLLGWGRAGTVPFEWIQPTKGPSVYHEYLEAHGEGFHHLGLDVGDMDVALRGLRERGLSVTMAGAWNVNGYEGRFAYLDAERFGGVTIELLWNKQR